MYVSFCSSIYPFLCVRVCVCFTQSSTQLSEDEQILQAIALSLGQDTSAEDKAKEEEEKKKKEKEEKDRLRQIEREIMAPISKEELDEFSDVLLSGCLELSVSVHDSVAPIVDLISAVGIRNEDEWREKALIQIKEKVDTVYIVSLTSDLQLYTCTCSCSIHVGTCNK